jgi:endonuclease/exonuclease/phosphatase family metal-dependent hydrolase
MRVASFNVNFGLSNDAETLATANELQAAVLLVQESNERWHSELSRVLSDRYPFQSFHPPNDWPASGMSVFSRWPLRNAKVLSAQGALFFAVRFVVDTPGGRVQMLNVHLTPDRPTLKGLLFRGAAQQQRQREIMAYIEQLDPKLATLIAGDFNDENSAPALRAASERGYVSALQRFAPKSVSWHWPSMERTSERRGAGPSMERTSERWGAGPVGSSELRMRIDHILVNGQLTLFGADVISRGRSDHYPIVALLDFNNE